MDLNDAFIAAVKAYYEGTEPERMKEASGVDLKYTKAYFDAIEKEFGLSSEEATDEDKIKLKGRSK